MQSKTSSADKQLGCGSYKLVVEGTNLGAVLATAGVDGTCTWSNHVAEMERVLGIEAARFKIMEQVHKLQHVINDNACL